MRALIVVFTNLLWLVVLVPACTTTSAKPAGKPYENCICGPASTASGEAQCAIWGDSKNQAQGIRVWESNAQSTCEPADCSRLFSAFCQKIQMSSLPKPVLSAPLGACYCDALLLENDRGQVQLFCAAWAEGGKNLIEYYALDDCPPQRCQEAPFNLAPKICNRNFKAFYPQLLNRR